jgi:hypothetical protein
MNVYHVMNSNIKTNKSIINTSINIIIHININVMI